MLRGNFICLFFFFFSVFLASFQSWFPKFSNFLVDLSLLCAEGLFWKLLRRKSGLLDFVWSCYGGVKTNYTSLWTDELLPLGNEYSSRERNEMLLAVAYENSHTCHTDLGEFIHPPPLCPPPSSSGLCNCSIAKSRNPSLTLVLRNLTQCPLPLINCFGFLYVYTCFCRRKITILVSQDGSPPVQDRKSVV